jgi:hypothetical protein
MSVTVQREPRVAQIRACRTSGGQIRLTGGAGQSAYRTPYPSSRGGTGPHASPARTDLRRPTISPRNLHRLHAPRHWHAQDRAQSWDGSWDVRPGQPADCAAPAIDSTNGGVPQALSTKHDEADTHSGWPTSGSHDGWDVRPAAATGPHSQDLSPIGGRVQAHFQPLPDRSMWTADYRHRRWYRTRRAVAGFAAAAAAIVAAGILAVTYTLPMPARIPPSWHRR